MVSYLNVDVYYSSEPIYCYFWAELAVNSKIGDSKFIQQTQIGTNKQPTYRGAQLILLSPR